MDNRKTKPELLRQYRDTGFNFVLLRRWNDKSARSGRDVGKAPLNKSWPSIKVSFDEAYEHSKDNHNVGVQLSVNGYAVLDYDPRQDPKAGTAQNALTRLMRDVGLEIEKQCRVVTGNREHDVPGQHIYLRIDPEWRGRTKLPKDDNPYPGCEFKHSPGQQVVAAGSVHPSGGMYVFHKNSVAMQDAAPAPSKLLEIYRQHSPERHLRGMGEDSWGAFSPEEIAKSLSYIDPADFNGEHEAWLNLMMAVHWATGAEGADIWVQWCIQDPEYADDEDDIRYRWDSLKLDPSKPMITSALIFKHLYERDVPSEAFPQRRIENMFDDVPEEEWIADTAQASPEVEVLNIMNRQHAMCLVGSKSQYLAPDVDPVSEQVIIKFVEAQALKDKYANRHITITEPGANGPKQVRKTWFEFWNTHPQRRTYDGVEFRPGIDEPERETDAGLYLNLFRGFPYSRRERGHGEWSNFGKLIFHAIAASNKDYYEYILKWIAYSIQNPEGPQGIAMVLRGDRGIGKGIFANAWVKCFGSAGMSTQSDEAITGQFNERLERTCALFLDEMFWAGNRKAEESIKHKITEPEISTEAKFQSRRNVRNNLKIMMATNNDWAVPAAMDERRFVVFDCKRVWPQEDDFYGLVKNELYRNGGLQAFFYDMANMDIEGFRPTRDYPRTDALKNQVYITLGPIAPWWSEILEQGEIPIAFGVGDQGEGPTDDEGEGPNWGEAPIAVPVQVLHKGFKNHQQRLHGDYEYRFDKKFKSDLGKLVPGGEVEKRRMTLPKTEDFMEYADKNGRCWCYILPSLPDLRKHAREKFNVDIEINDPKDEDDDEEFDDFI